LATATWSASDLCPAARTAANFSTTPRNRLTGAAPSTAQSVTYAYYPFGLMSSSTLASGDALQFYYDGGAIPQVTNINQASTDTWSTYLGDMTYLSDGTEQMRCRPRKDVAGIYVPTQQSFTPQTYEPYGASTSAATAGATTYDMHQNPFQYAGEYKDADWNGYYLRARWYLPDYQTFLARDPQDAIHRYGYAEGDPVGHVDPTGLRSSYGEFSRDVNHFLRPVNKGLRGELLPLLPVYGQVVGGIQLLGNLPEVWHHPNFETWASFSFLVASIAAEATDALPAFDSASGAVKAFSGRVGVDLTIGIGQTALTSVGPHGKLDTHALWQSMAYNASGILWGRLFGRFGYRPFGMTDDDVNALVQSHFQSGDAQGLVFRVRYKPGFWAFTSPILEGPGWGNYHEAVFAATPERLWLGDVNLGQGSDDYVWKTRWSSAAGDLDTPSQFLTGKSASTRQYVLVGKFRTDAIESGFMRQMESEHQEMVYRNETGRVSSPFNNYNKMLNNCQQNAARLRANIARFNRMPAPEFEDLTD
jgi:RHS repeat-associated protein